MVGLNFLYARPVTRVPLPAVSTPRRLPRGAVRETCIHMYINYIMKCIIDTYIYVYIYIYQVYSHIYVLIICTCICICIGLKVIKKMVSQCQRHYHGRAW